MWKRQNRYTRPRFNGRVIISEQDLVIPEEKTIVAMTKGEDNVPVRIGDFFAHKNEAYLTSKMLGAEKDFDKVFAKLLEDLKQTMNRRNHYTMRYDAWKHWALSIDEFVSLTPYFKPFFHGCTRDAMRLLLLQTRRDVLQLHEKDPRRHSRRKNTLTTKPVEKEITCKHSDRLTPLNEDVYKNFIDLLVLTRLGSDAHNSLNVFMLKRQAWAMNYLLPVISNKIELTIKGTPVFRNSWMTFLKETDRKTSSKLKKLADFEKQLDSRTKKVGVNLWTS
jgi:hypothetical protein